MNIIYPKIGQIEKELDFKSLLRIFSRFIHNFFTKPVEKSTDKFLSLKKVFDTRPLRVSLKPTLTFETRKSPVQIAIPIQESHLEIIKRG